MKRARIIQFIIQPVVVADDGENLTPIDVKPVAVAAASLAQFAVNGAADLLAQIQKQLDEETKQ
jgi:hypothetical protein